ncbi:MAG: trypsin-like peptidase domain-containing protein [Pirellulaceae bacterium]|nr:trypsin-like peptidase domain-containing protein [Pirellulaceae bacterium]
MEPSQPFESPPDRPPRPTPSTDIEQSSSLPPPSPQRPRADRSSFWQWISLALSGMALLYAGVLTWERVGPLYDSDARPRSVTQRGDLAADEKSTIELYQYASKSVVYISTNQYNAALVGLVESPRGRGSGFIWDEKGYIVTNSHVIEGSSSISVTLHDKTVRQATLVGHLPSKDLAVLKIDPQGKKLIPIDLGSSYDLQVGQKTFAIGNPFGLDQTLTTGIISGLERSIKTNTSKIIHGVIQTDAAINPGNSGGPLLDSAGRLIGVNTAIASATGASSGVGFALPVDLVNRIVPAIIRQGSYQPPDLGVQILSSRQARLYGVGKGVLITKVRQGGPADKAELKACTRDRYGRFRYGDILLEIDGVPITDDQHYLDLQENYNDGDLVTIKLLRDFNTRNQKTLELDIRLETLK